MRHEEVSFLNDIAEIRDGTLMDLCLIREYTVESEDGEKGKKLTSRIAEMLRSLIARIKRGIATFNEKLKKRIETEKFKRDIKKLKSSKVETTVEFIDVWEYEKLFKAEVRELCRLCEDWRRAYEKGGASVGQANRFMDHYKDIVDMYEPKIAEVKKNKIKVSSSKVRKWLLLNTQINGEPAGMLQIYLKRLEECQKTFEEVQKKKADYIAKTGYHDGDPSFTKFVTNASIYVKRNADWLTMFAISSVTLFIGYEIEQSAKKDIGKGFKPDHSEEEEQRKEKKKFENEHFNDPDYKSKKKTASKIVRKGAVGAAALGAVTKMRSTNRTGI